ncbi:MAG: carboxypeptidase M32 [Thiofilum sp.]|uniref:carboxypeptidase M32 n=1 Tax=Thiofilum sp. TaxID=2212733 RepID=UPI0025D2F482|nr:carboxypeptidase M32 [Thiofilum sp.]MBK8452140.1 carboxypeptidase M32 [Thiofilum sp.]
MTQTALALTELKSLLNEVCDLNNANAVLGWDQSTYMPSGGGATRGRQMATLEKIAHEKLTAPRTGELLENLKSYEQELPYDHDDAALLRLARRYYEQATKVPSEFLAAFSEHSSNTYLAWVKARPANDFKSVQPLLKKTLDMSRQLAEYYGYDEHIADPLINLADYGMKASTIRALFAELRSELVPLVKTITEQPLADDSCLLQHYPEAQQFAFSTPIIKRFGYDFERGRQDKTAHPFMTKFANGDVRITTRVKEHDFSEAFFSTTHETGHALYEQGINPAFDGTFLDNGTSSGVHESQSRTWENLVSRSRAFWSYYYPSLQQQFPAQLNQVSLDTFYRAINKVQRSLIRTDADEVTYNLHVMIRFELELQMLEGKLAVKDLPEAWNAAYQNDLGITPPNDSNGCMQDVHWYGGRIGGVFQSYTIGNILSAQFFESALKAYPDINNEIAQGQFSTLHHWLKTNIYQYGSKFTANKMIERATGRGLDIAPYMQYLRTKYGELYTL